MIVPVIIKDDKFVQLEPVEGSMDMSPAEAEAFCKLHNCVGYQAAPSEKEQDGGS